MLKLRYHEPHDSYIIFIIYLKSHCRNQSQVCPCSSLVPIQAGVRTRPPSSKSNPVSSACYFISKGTHPSLSTRVKFSNSIPLISPFDFSNMARMIRRYPLVCLVSYLYVASARSAGRWPTAISITKLRMRLENIICSSAST